MVSRNENIDVKKAVRLGADYIMLNSVATDSTSLFYGRAGMSICLFEVARFLDDEYIEDHAFTLLQQSLVNERKEIRFDAGLSGIGYALNYLIRNKFVDADFMEIFRNQHDIIVKGFLSLDFSKMSLKELVEWWNLIPYFHYVPDIHVNKKVMELHKSCIAKFRNTWKNLVNCDACLDKELISSLWVNYLKVLSLVDRVNSCKHIKEYLGLLEKGMLKRNIRALHYISVIIFKNQESFSLDATELSILKYGICDFLPVDSINVNNMFSEPFISSQLVQTDILSWFTCGNCKELESNINKRMEFSPFTASLSFGLSGMILGVISIVNKNGRIVNEILGLL